MKNQKCKENICRPREGGMREPRIIDTELRLVPYYPNEETALAWYQDAQLCRQVDNMEGVYSLERLRRMYSFLNAHGNCFYIQYNGKLIGDVTLRNDGEISIVICREYQNRHIGRRCVQEMLALAAEKKMCQVRANIYAFNTQSRKMFESVGFVQTTEEWYACPLKNTESTER